MNDLEFQGFRLDVGRRQLRRGEDVLALPAKAFDLLVYLAGNPGRPLPKSELIAHIWPDSFVEDANLNQTVFLIRKVLGPQHDRLIVTLPKVGYQFSAQVEEVARHDSGYSLQGPALAPAVPAFAGEVSTQTTISRVVYEEETEERIPFYRSPVVLAISSVALVLLAVAGWLGWQRWEDRVGGPPVQVVIAASDGTTGDPVLDLALANLLRIELAQSPFVNLVPAAIVRDKLVQMQHKPDETLNVNLAREICERTGSQAVLHGSVARAGSTYLLTEEATNCLDGNAIGAVSRSVSRAEELPRALSQMTSELRHTLGESRRTIARFASPLYPVTTTSLDALKAFTEATRLSGQGHMEESTSLLQKAVSLDPNFASAWVDLSTVSYNNMDREQGAIYLQKAYDTRAYATEPLQLFITGRYTSEVTGDLYEGIRNCLSWAELYRRAAQPWSMLAVNYRALGKNTEELAAARKTMERLPSFYVVNYALVDAQIRNRDYVGGRATADSAVSRGLDGDAIRDFMWRIGYLQQDTAFFALQEAWGREHPDSSFLLADQMQVAAAQGRLAGSAKLVDRLRAVAKHDGQLDFESSIVAGEVSDLVLLAEGKTASTLLATLPSSPANFDYLRALADTGSGSQVEALLAVQLAKNPHSTLWNEWYGPILRGTNLLKANKAQEALKVLEPTRQFDGKSFEAIYLRAKAYLALGQLPQAEAELRKILEHPELTPTAVETPVAKLQLARLLAREGKKPEAAEVYRSLLADWSHADEGQPLVQQARSESRQL